MKIHSILLVLFSIFAINSFGQNASSDHWQTADSIVSAIKTPTFQDRTFNITNFGAVGDGHKLNTDAFKKAITTCSQSGGGKVVVPPGLWLTGPIELQSNVNLHLDRGALVVFSPEHKNYPMIDPPKRSILAHPPVYGANLENVAITGEGILDGAGETWRPVKKSKTTASQWKDLVKSGGIVNEKSNIWWPSKEAMNGKQFIKELRKTKDKKDLTPQDYLPARDYLRPYMVLLISCKKVLIDGPTIKNSPKFALVPNWSEDITIRNVQINNEWWAQNGDGIDISSCKNVLIDHCNVTAGDDGIAVKSSFSKNSYPTLANVVVKNCIVYHAHGGFVIGSNTDGGMSNVFVSNCDFVGTDIGLRFKSARDRGGLVENFFIKNIYMKDIIHEAILFNTYYENADQGNVQPVTQFTPRFEKFYIDSVYCVGAKQAILMRGLPEMPIKDIYINHAYLAADNGFQSDFAAGIHLKNVEIDPKESPIFSIDESQDFTIDQAIIPADTRQFMQVDGVQTKNITITNTDLSNVSKSIEYGSQADKKSVMIKEIE
ncbi:MAG TPA: glycoside hydrolase family 28 protein [Sunxiuqinia sp.]|nr:glycoside hydrolase family 28 protein [Sunxiuqinia sp.]